MWCFLLAILTLLTASQSHASNSTYTNPVMPGWHSDPSCIFAPDLDDTFFCTTSTFSVLPGSPIYASKDLLDWKLVSNALHNPKQLPILGTRLDPSDGTFAATLRRHDGVFYLITVYLSVDPFTIQGLIFNSTNIYNDSSWGQPMPYAAVGIDPDLFWDNGTTYITQTTGTGIYQSTIDLTTGSLGDVYNLWNGTGYPSPEGPHMYKADGYYYLLIAEGGTATNHSVTMARSRSISGVYESCPYNPVLTNRGTTQYFQTVGHADLFQDAAGKWWGMALATRSGPAFVNYPMGRESVLFPVTWNTGDWPIMTQITGRMTGWQLPNAAGKKIPGTGSFVEVADDVKFAPNSSIPSHFIYWRYPRTSSFVVSPAGHAHTLQLTPSNANLTGNAAFVPTAGITFLGRRQTHTLFTYSVNIDFTPTVQGEEVGVSVFLTQDQHIDLGIVLLPCQTSRALIRQFRFRTTVLGKADQYVPTTTLSPIPKGWLGSKIQLRIEAVNETHYLFSAAPAASTLQVQNIGYAPATIVSGGTGPFTGSLLGVYATSNGGNGTTLSYISKWKYEGIAQNIGDGEWSPPIA